MFLVPLPVDPLTSSRPEDCVLLGFWKVVTEDLCVGDHATGFETYFCESYSVVFYFMELKACANYDLFPVVRKLGSLYKCQCLL